MRELIDREQVYDILEDAYDTMKHQGFSAIASVIKATGEQIMNMPAVEVKRVVRARWLTSSRLSKKGNSHSLSDYDVVKCNICSYCARKSDERTNFCPNCGAEMDGVK